MKCRLASRACFATATCRSGGSRLDQEVALVDERVDGGAVADVDRQSLPSCGSRDRGGRPFALDVGDGHFEVGAIEQVAHQRARDHARAQNEHLLHRKLLRYS